MSWPPLSADDLTLLAQRLREGDPSGGETFVRLFGERIRAMMLVRTRDPEVARELTQDVMLAAWRAIREGRLRDPECLAAFVYGTARNVANSYARARAGAPRLEPLDPDTEPIADPGDDDSSERRALVASALRRLSAGDRQVLLLTLVHDLTPREIARRLHLGVDVVRARKSRALKRIIDAVAALSRSAKNTH